MNYANLLLQVLDLAIVGALTYERAKALQDLIKALVDEQRDPTPAEWATLRNEGIDLDARLDAANSRLNG
ncbi:hypothetical protein [Rhizorhabdus sp.]|uniref:hypothetical protein n=1 Tax=Rhizorhabdus sp. TaxID=1968843 RepID=UPI0035B2C192